jgi:C4-type Zn-finger protein
MGALHMAARNSSLPIVECPGCRTAMVAIERRPLPNSDGLLRVVYRCESCGIETTRTFKHPTGGA